MSFAIVTGGADEALAPRPFTRNVRSYLSVVDKERKKKQELTEWMNNLPVDVVEEKILTKATCEARSKYCDGMGVPLEDHRIDLTGKTTTCADKSFRRLHDAMCAARKDRRDADKLSDEANLLLDYAEAAVTGEDVRERRDRELMALLSDTPRNLFGDEWTQLFVATAHEGSVKVVDFLLREKGGKVDPTARDNQAIINASENGHVKVVELLLKDGRVDPTAQNNQAIINASIIGRTKVVELLLAWKGQKGERVDPAARSNVAIIHSDHAKVVELLLKDGKVDPAARDNQAIINASEYGSAAVVELLLKDGRVDPAARDNQAIINARRNGHAGVVKLLLKDGRVDPAAQ